jgi:uncharacterized phage-associated protein
MDIKTLKIINSILFFVNKSKNNSITRLKLMKLLWLSDRLHLNKYGRLILKDNYCALPHGPVPSLALDYSKSSLPEKYFVKGFCIVSNATFEKDYFSKSDIEVMEFVWNKFGNLSEFDLRDLSHQFPEWLRFKADLENTYTPNSYDMVMDDFFVFPKKNTLRQIFEIDNIESSKSYFHSYNAIQSNLNKQCH